jgi:hypothetical protein
MPSSHQQPARLTKKQKKATAFRERGSDKSKGKGKGKFKPNPTPGHGHSRPLPPTTTTTGDNGGDGYDDDDEDANAIPAMEDQDQALAAMARYTEGDAKGDDSLRVPKKTAMESTSTSTAAPSKGKRKRGRGSNSRVEELGEVSEETAQPGPKKKKARISRSSEEILPAHEEDGATSMNDDEEDGSKTKSKGSKPLRYILFIGNVPLPHL